MKKESMLDGMSDKLQSGKQVGREGLQKIIYGRTAVNILLFLVQIFALVLLYHWLREKSIYLLTASAITGLILAIHVINRDIDAGFKISWLIPILLMPAFGMFVYLFWHMQMGTKNINRRLREEIRMTKSYLRQDPDVMYRLEREDADGANLAHYLYRYGGYPVYSNTDVVYFPLGEDKWEEMLFQLENATSFIFLEYFIVEDGEMWESILEILKRKAREGVEIRVLYDGMNSLARLHYQNPRDLSAYDIQCCMFNPIRPVLSTAQNNRDHRKILVIDGRVAFTGGVNIADEYVNRKERFGHWKDVAVMIEGEAVTSFTMMFLQMWNISSPAQESYARYLVSCPNQRKNNGYVIPYGDSPLDKENVGEMVYLDMIYHARDYLYLYTPYLMLDGDMTTALKYAAKRGVDIRMILPHIPDKKYAYYLARTHYRELIDAGVKIYEYLPGFVHAKAFVSDDRVATVGTVNLDYRSLYLHFECGVYFCQVEAVLDVRDDFAETLKRCKAITREDCRRYPLWKKGVGKILRLFAPLM